MVRGNAKTKRAKSEKPETFIKRIVHTHYLLGFNNLSQDVLATILPEGAALMSVSDFMTIEPKDKGVLFDPTPKDLRMVVAYICDVIEFLSERIKAGDHQTIIDEMATVPMAPMRAIIQELETDRAIMTPLEDARPVNSSLNTAMVVNLVIRLIGYIINMHMAAFVACKRVPKSNEFATFCAIIGLPPTLLRIARETVLPEPKKKGTPKDDEATTSATH